MGNLNFCASCTGGKEEYKFSSESPKSDKSNQSPRRKEILTVPTRENHEQRIYSIGDEKRVNEKEGVVLEHPRKRIEIMKNEKIEIVVEKKEENVTSAKLVTKEENSQDFNEGSTKNARESQQSQSDYENPPSSSEVFQIKEEKGYIEDATSMEVESVESQIPKNDDSEAVTEIPSNVDEDSPTQDGEDSDSSSSSEILSSSLLQMTEEDEAILHTLFRGDVEEKLPLDIENRETEPGAAVEPPPLEREDPENKGQQEYELVVETATIDSSSLPCTDAGSPKTDNRESLAVDSASPYESMDHITQEDQDLLSEIFGEEEAVDFGEALEKEIERQSMESEKEAVTATTGGEKEPSEDDDVILSTGQNEEPTQPASQRSKKRRRRSRRSRSRRRKSGEEESDEKNNSHSSFDVKKLVLDEKISSGAFGVVKRGRYFSNGIPTETTSEVDNNSTKKKKEKDYLDVAIKEMKVLNLKELKHVEHEINLQKKLDHPNVLGCLGSWFEGNRGFVVLELCEKGDLSKYKFRISKSKRMKMKFIEQIAKGMTYLHERNIIHRDLKAQNILVTREKKIKICDFGTSKRVGSFQMSFVGTVEYIPPEIVFGTVDNKKIESDPKLIDVYSYGILIWEIWSSKQPFSELRKRIPNPYPLLREIHMNQRRPGVDDPTLHDMPIRLKKLMERCWSHSPFDRPQFEEITKVIKKIRKSMKKEQQEEKE